MKYGVLVYDKFSQFGGKNIGDYIQSLAAAQFLPENSNPLYVYRDSLNEWQGEFVKIIMNGWYTHLPENFPPSEQVIPLFVSIHINSTVKDRLLTPHFIDYLKKHEPIGCRDKYTEQLLAGKGIKSYFSGCMTLTLGKSYATTETSDEVIFVDPYISLEKSVGNCLGLLKMLLTKFHVAFALRKKLFSKAGLKNFCKTALFLSQYKTIWDESFLLSATYIHHMFDFETEGEYFAEAERLIKRYAKAKLVITSRIHAALPCTGLETPVLFINNEKDSELSTCRFGGLLDLLNVINHDGTKLINTNAINVNCPPIRKEYKVLAENLISRCENFMSEK